MNLELARVVWRSSWWLRSCGTTTRSCSSSPSHLLQPAQTTLLKSTKGSGTDPVNATARYVAYRGLVVTALLSPSEMRHVTMKFKRKSKYRMGMRPSDEHSNYESSYNSDEEEEHTSDECKDDDEDGVELDISSSSEGLGPSAPPPLAAGFVLKL
ncbi:hypothetical protein Taro_016039 [Colocasia esculenta]|uniref:Uncharacterized protein n=1 Tax=Colocasia esculenta TaxID=4460 RepID=A0A843UMH8_COLES|nr:hypothetical protein [Colocasia esculenta]